MIKLTQVILQVRAWSWFDSNMTMVGEGYVIPLTFAWLKSRASFDLTHKLLQILFPPCLIRLMHMYDSNHTSKISIIQVFNYVLRFYLWYDFNQSQLWFLFQKTWLIDLKNNVQTKKQTLWIMHAKKIDPTRYAIEEETQI